MFCCLMEKMRQKGTAMVEYSALLAFVIVIGGVFMYGSNINSAISDVIDKVTSTVANEESKSKYRYNANVDPKYKEYTDFTNELINKVYDKLVEDQNIKGTNQKICYVWIKNGQIEEYNVYNNENGKLGGAKKLSTPIIISDLIKDNSQYTICTKAHSKLCFNTAGNIINEKIAWNDISRIYIANSNTPNKWSTCLTFNQSNNKFSGDADYWVE